MNALTATLPAPLTEAPPRKARVRDPREVAPPGYELALQVPEGSRVDALTFALAVLRRRQGLLLTPGHYSIPADGTRWEWWTHQPVGWMIFRPRKEVTS